MIVLVCGGRYYHDQARVFQELDELHSSIGPFIRVIHGAAMGADQLGQLWAEARGIEHVPYYANWERHGRSAGPIRNQRMLTKGTPHMVVAFPGGRGTADMVARARRAGLMVVEVSP